MILEGCQGKAKEVSIIDKRCPQCGNELELFSVDTEVVCEKCGYKVYNDTLSCIQWCKYSKKCVGDEMYEKVMTLLEQRKLRAEREKSEARE